VCRYELIKPDVKDIAAAVDAAKSGTVLATWIAAGSSGSGPFNESVK
jgi:hypothetical protein